MFLFQFGLWALLQSQKEAGKNEKITSKEINNSERIALRSYLCQNWNLVDYSDSHYFLCAEKQC
jgi:hypothetical protein